VKLAGQVASKTEEESTYIILVGQPEEKVVSWKMILKWILRWMI
jgi:hypothetical protein